MSQVEVEVKSLLGNLENAKSLISKLESDGFDLQNVKKSSQLNHYFIVKDLDSFKERATSLVSTEKQSELESILSRGLNFSVRTRDSNGKVIFVVKASLDDQTSSNGVTRLEFEQVVDMSLDELDKYLLDSGLEYQAKWSRYREEFAKDNITVCIDKNAGYGYLAEFEMVGEENEDLGAIRKKIDNLMSKYGIVELDQGHLARMFDYYNNNWSKYYGTDNIFTIE
jgi:adenylate cyclase class IV